MRLRGATLGRTIKILFILVIIAVLIGAIDLIIDAVGSGIIEELTPNKK